MQLEGKRTPQRVGTKLTFDSYADHSVTFSSAAQTTYEAIEAELQTALEDVRHRIENNVQLSFENAPKMPLLG